jgi:hypothetical protein
VYIISQVRVRRTSPIRNYLRLHGAYVPAMFGILVALTQVIPLRPPQVLSVLMIALPFLFERMEILEVNN